MEFEDIEIGLLNEHASVPDKAEVLARFQDGLVERLRGEPDVHAVESDDAVDESLDELAAGEGDADASSEEFSEQSEEGAETIEVQEDEAFLTDADSEEEEASGAEAGMEAEAEANADGESEAEFMDEEQGDTSGEAVTDEDSMDADEVATLEEPEEEVTPAEVSEESAGVEEEPEKDYSDEWTPEELAELGEDA